MTSSTMHSKSLAFNSIAALFCILIWLAVAQSSNALPSSDCPQLKCNGVCGESANAYEAFNYTCEMRNINIVQGEKYDSVDQRFCECPICPNIGPKVCAHDGKTNVLFENECSVEVFNCQFQRNFVRTLNQSACDSNESSHCPAPCDDEHAPVCVQRGDNIQLFSSKCYLKYHNCKFGDNYRLTDCSNCHEDRSTIDDDSQPSDCPQICPALYDPVCGRDKSKRYREFSNACFMGIHNCQNPHNRYEAVSLSFCRNDCDNRVCSYLYGNFCITDGFENVQVHSLCDIERLKCKTGRDFQMAPLSHCDCPAIACTKEYAPICATGGTSAKIYSTLCQLSAITCNYTKNIVPIDQSFCTNPTELCPNERQCRNQYYPVCTEISDNRFELVDSPCRLHSKNCNDPSKNVFNVVNINMCRTRVALRCRNRMCSSYQYEPVCASNASGSFKWFGNQCSLDLFNCNQGDDKKEYFKAPIQFCSDIIQINVR